MHLESQRRPSDEVAREDLHRKADSAEWDDHLWHFTVFPSQQIKPGLFAMWETSVNLISFLGFGVFKNCATDCFRGCSGSHRELIWRLCMISDNKVDV